MAAFKDMNGKEWFVSINVSAVKVVLERTGYNLMRVLGTDAVTKLSQDLISVVDILYILCQEQAEKAGITDEDFGKALGGFSLGHAVNAFLEALVNFSQTPEEADVLRETIKTVQESKRLTMQRMKKMAKDPKFLEKLNEELEKPIDYASLWRESSALTPDLSRSES